MLISAQHWSSVVTQSTKEAKRKKQIMSRCIFPDQKIVKITTIAKPRVMLSSDFSDPNISMYILHTVL